MTPYEQAKQAGYTDEQIMEFLKYKFGNQWKEKAKQYGVPNFNSNAANINNNKFNTDSNPLPDKIDANSILNNDNIQHIDIGDINAQTNNKEIMATMTPEQVKQDRETQKAYEKSFDAFQTGDAQAFAGVGRALLDVLNAAGIDTSKANSYLDSVIKELHKESEQQEKEGYGAWNIAGNIAPSLLIPGGAFKTLPRAAAVGFADAYANARGNDNDKLTSLLAGTGGAVTGGLAFKIIDKLQGKDVDRLYNWLKQRYNLTDDEINDAYNKYLNVMQSSGDVKKDKIKAIIFSLGDHGKTLIQEAIREKGQPVANTIIREMKARTNEIDDRVNPSIDASNIIESAKNKIDEVKNNYSSFVNKVADIKDKPIDTKLPEALDEVSHSINTGIADKIINNSNPTLADYIDAYQLASKAERTTRDAQKAFKYNILKQKIEDKLKSRLTPEEFEEWKKVNTDYAKMSSIYNKFGPEIEAVNRGEMSPDVLIKKIANSKESLNANTFKNLEFLVGKDKMPELEKAIVKQYYNPTGVNKATWNYVYNKIKDKAFITPEGKQLQKDFENLAKAFKVDDILKSLTGKARQESVGWSDDLISKAKFSIIGKIWNWLTKKLPTENARYMRKMDTLAKILKQESVPLPKLIDEGLKEAFTKEDYEKLLSNRQNRINYFKNLNNRVQELPVKTQKKLSPILKAYKKAIADGRFDDATKMTNQIKKVAGKDFEVIKPTDIYNSMKKGSINFNKLNKEHQSYLDLIKVIDEDDYNKYVNAMKEMDEKGINYKTLDDVKDYILNSRTKGRLYATPSQKEALREYVVGDYVNINKVLRNSLKNTHYDDVKKELLKFFRQPGNYKGIVYRGTALPKNLIKDLKPGTVYLNKPILSSSKNEDIARTYLEYAKETKDENLIPVWFKIDVEHPQYDISKLINTYNEEEILIKPGSFLKVMTKKTHPDHVEFWVKVLPKSKLGKYTGMRKGAIYIGGEKRAKPTIDFRYKLNDEINKLNDRQKYNPEQLRNYLIKKGVSPKEIESSELFNYIDRPATGKEIKQLFNSVGNKHTIFEVNTIEPEYEDVKLNKSYDYKESLDLIDKEQGVDNHFDDVYKTIKNVDGQNFYSNRQALGWRRFSEIDLPDGKATVLNEIQSDWESASRRGSTNADFPMNSKKYYMYSIVKGIQKAIEDDTNRLIIPISRQNELAGTEGVEKFYRVNVANMLNDIKKKLGKQGIKLHIQKRVLPNYTTDVPRDILDKLNQIDTNEKLADFYFEDLDFNSFLYEHKLDEKLYDLYEKALENEAPVKEIKKELLQRIKDELNKKTEVWDIKIDSHSNDKAIWYIYSLLGTLGIPLSREHKSKNKEENNVSTKTFQNR